MIKQRKLGRGVAIVGAGMSRFGMFKDKDSQDLFADAFREMMASVDKGMDPKDIDALYLGNFSNDFFVDQAHWAPIISDLIGHTPKPAHKNGRRMRFKCPCFQGRRVCHCIRFL